MPTYPVKRSGQIEAGQTFEVRFRPAMPGVIKVISQVTRRPGTHIGGFGSSHEHSPDTDSVLRQKLELFKPGSPSPVASKTGDQDELLVWCDGEASAADVTGADWVVRITNLSDVRGSCDVTVRYPTRQGNLGKIDHIVVVMMENRSFDHMLGYLRLQGGRDDIDGLTSNESNTYNGTVYPVRPLTNTFFNADPDHGKGGVEEQLGLSPLNREDDTGEGDHSGFVKNFATVDKRRDPGQPPEELGAIMGYYTAPQVPTYDFLAREFTVCDRWFCSVPGATWPNRLYALSGSSAGTKDNDSDQANDDPPGFDLKTIFEFLQERGVEWTSYYSDFPFALIFKGIAQDATYTARIRPIHEFFQKAKTGDLPAVSWLDPNYEDVPESNWPNDDHPPIDILNGQAFVAKLYQALVSSPAWSKTLFVITYDEHGGFYDHVKRPAAEDDHEKFRRYGVRVPAFVVSPWVARRSVSKEIYDHTSILKTILLRFCASGDLTGSGRVTVPSMGKRVDAARDLSPLLTSERPRTNIPAGPIPAVQPRPGLAHRRSTDGFSSVLRRKLFGF